MVYLPPELVELILEQLEYELRPTLRACALVCKAWLPTVLRFLFHRFSLSPDSRLVRSLDTDAHLVFPHYVRELTIYTPGSSPSELKDILPYLPRFDRVHGLCLSLWGPHHNAVYHLPHTHIRELDLHFISFSDFYSLQVFVATFSQLESSSCIPSARTRTSLNLMLISTLVTCARPRAFASSDTAVRGLPHPVPPLALRPFAHTRRPHPLWNSFQ
ncbi:hypothetical protein BD779DRAFT_66260 [Infundibulicybe gibba]|nr:hypothetical protein BD779DRAFT_66260 [Infundibulicybe gibba]